jgi:flagellar biosynthetic protein FliO
MNKQNRRNIILTSVILAVAIIGLIATGSLSGRHDPTAAEALRQLVQDASPNPSTAANDGSPVMAILKLISALAIVIVALYGGLYLLKRLMTGRRSVSAKLATLEVIESAYVGPKKTVSLVRVGKRAVLVGVTDQQITKLTDVDEHEVAELLSAEPEAKSGETFAQMFKRTTDKFRQMQVSKEHKIVEA